jgi:Phosphotransferase enzyme family
VRWWSTVLRVPTIDGALWFKANAPPHAFEAGLPAILERVSPGHVFELVALDADRGWLLIRDCGERLRELVSSSSDLFHWRKLLPEYAELQLALAPHAGGLLAAGVPDERLAVLPAQLGRPARRSRGLHGRPENGLTTEEHERLETLLPEYADTCARLTAFGIPETLQHDDLHDGNVFVRDDRQLILDWGDAVVSHPFFSLSVALEGAVAWGLDDVENSVDIAPLVARYLRRYDPDRPELADAFPLALRLGWACRAANASVVEDPGSTRERLKMFLDGRAD